MKRANMPERTIFETSIWQWIWLLVLAFWGGLTNYITRVKSGKAEKFSLAELIGEVTIAGFAGVMAFHLCDALGMSYAWTAATVGVAGHMGGRFIFVLETLLKRKFGAQQDEQQ